MNKIIGRIWGPIVFLVDALLLIDIATDLVKKYKDRKAKKQTIVSDNTEEEPAPVETIEE